MIKSNKSDIVLLGCMLGRINGLSNDLATQNTVAEIATRYEKIHNSVVDEFGIHGIYMLALLALFIFTILIIHIKSAIDTFKEGSGQTDRNYVPPKQLLLEAPDTQQSFDEQQYSEDENIIEDDEQTLSPDEELSKSLVEVSSVSDDILNIQADYAKLKMKMGNHARQNKQSLSYLKQRYEQQLADIHKEEQLQQNLNDEQRKKKDIHDLVSMILNLLGRKVSASKTVQAIFFYNQERYSEQDIMQLVQTIRDFIGLCNAGHFDLLPNRENLPTNKEAVYAWAHGDTTPCLSLLQSYLNVLMEQSAHEQGLIKDMTYAQAANCACIMGNIARLTDMDLAHNSFELATELSPRSTCAWSNLADIYAAEDNKERALIAYQTVLDLGDNIMYAWQLANAQNNMADYYEKLGVEAKARELRQNCYDFYKDYGIRMPLSTAETAAFALIYSQKDNNLDSSLDNLISAETSFMR
ncbi:MAG: hypothetical protein VZR95_01305 [Alphaproteobacteria bacterium]